VTISGCMVAKCDPDGKCGFGGRRWDGTSVLPVAQRRCRYRKRDQCVSDAGQSTRFAGDQRRASYRWSRHGRL
jgi:hypothetical protein